MSSASRRISAPDNKEPGLGYIDSLAAVLDAKLKEYDEETARRLNLWRERKLDVLEIYSPELDRAVNIVAEKLRTAMELRSQGRERAHHLHLLEESRVFEADNVAKSRFKVIAKVGYSEEHNNWGVFIYGPEKAARTPDGRLRSELRLTLSRPWFRWLP